MVSKSLGALVLYLVGILAGVDHLGHLVADDVDVLGYLLYGHHAVAGEFGSFIGREDVVDFVHIVKEYRLIACSHR